MWRLPLSAFVLICGLFLVAVAEADVVPECPEGSRPVANGGEWNHGGIRCLNADGEEVTEDDDGLCAVGGRPAGSLVPMALVAVALVAARRSRRA